MENNKPTLFGKAFGEHISMPMILNVGLLLLTMNFFMESTKLTFAGAALCIFSGLCYLVMGLAKVLRSKDG